MLRRLTAPGREPWILAAASLLVLAAAPAQYLGRQHDDILFVVASHALSLGNYALFTSPGAPPLTHVWPGTPAIFLPATWAFGERLWGYQLYAAAILAACPWALWWWLRGRTSRGTAVLAPLVFASSPLVLAQAGCVMSEAPYTLLAAVLLRWCEAPRLEAARASWALLALTLSRPASLAALPALAARPLARGRWKEASRLLAPAAVGLLAWVAWSWLRGSVQEAGEWAASYRGRGLGGLVELPAANARFFLDALGSSFLPPSIAGGRVALLAGAAFSAVAALGVWRALKRRFDDPALLMLAAAVPMHLFWGWQYERYLIPLLPLLLLAASEALGKRAELCLGALLGLQLVFQVPRFLSPSPAAVPELAATYAWLREHREAGQVLASPLYVRDGYYAGMPSLPLADAEDAEALSLLSRRWRVRYILWQDLDMGLSRDAGSSIRGTFDHVGRLLEDSRRFRPVFSDEAGNAVVYEVI